MCICLLSIIISITSVMKVIVNLLQPTNLGAWPSKVILVENPFLHLRVRSVDWFNPGYLQSRRVLRFLALGSQELLFLQPGHNTRTKYCITWTSHLHCIRTRISRATLLHLHKETPLYNYWCHDQDAIVVIQISC